MGPVYIEPKREPGNYDREVFLVLKEFEPTFSRGGDMPMDFLAGETDRPPQEIGESAMRASLAKDGADPVSLTQPEFVRFVLCEAENAKRIIEAAGIKPQ